MSLFRSVILNAAENPTARPFSSFRVTTLLYQSHAVWFRLPVSHVCAVPRPPVAIVLASQGKIIIITECNRWCGQMTLRLTTSLSQERNIYSLQTGKQ